jgi:hypothetical protein
MGLKRTLSEKAVTAVVAVVSRELHSVFLLANIAPAQSLSKPLTEISTVAVPIALTQSLLEGNSILKWTKGC